MTTACILLSRYTPAFQTKNQTNKKPQPPQQFLLFFLKLLAMAKEWAHTYKIAPAHLEADQHVCHFRDPLPVNKKAISSGNKAMYFWQ